ncbi:hypothetical protein CHU98_g10564 [Xylaria longipes]|nr:hypothetical protein CHU98_g10564 [Xylaria longipes]
MSLILVPATLNDLLGLLSQPIYFFDNEINFANSLAPISAKRNGYIKNKVFWFRDGRSVDEELESVRRSAT